MLPSLVGLHLFVVYLLGFVRTGSSFSSNPTNGLRAILPLGHLFTICTSDDTISTASWK